METNKETFPEGHFINKWTGLGIAIFSGIGIPISIITGNLGLIGIGPAIGVAVGVSVGQSMEKKYAKEGRIRPLNDQEKRKRKMTTYVGLAIMILGLITFLLIYLLK
ncbi:hypothetical protein G3567_10860 [Psychroflexus sp. YR1-1]|uniref:Uncharacterized protein n=1 Tax=Psychroflexus aurantiacus TaxID=2709310 RepID=A0A6B3RAW2_9FLAO|nr:hypothetical protein [Psychroflexus aurantiacus]NEV94644.1 hypothetical protein [Psychroflexus aurantiacus]